ncbi:MAG TPA: glycosyltransferase family 4 protein [Chloroflexota bacterium]|nr:glycosyltransferase family 4 protein [Chloroflexota bacterium]
MNTIPTVHDSLSESTRGMKLLYMINSLGRGGAERSLAELLPYYLQHGLQVTIVCLHRMQQGVEQEVRQLPCRLHFLPQGGWGQRIRALRHILRDERPDLVHTTLFESDFIGRCAAIRTGIPVLTSLVNTSYENVRLSDPNVRWSRLMAVRLADGISAHLLTSHFHAVSQAVKESAVHTLYLPAHKITVVPRGRDPVRLGVASLERKLRVRARLGIPADAAVVLNVARQEFQKGQRFLIEAFAALARDRPNLLLVLAGRPGHATPELEKLHRATGLGDRIRFLGHRDDVPDLLAAADIFAFPSLYEGLGCAALEAMALALPIVASDIPPLREVVVEGENGTLVEPESSEAMAKALASLLDSPDVRLRYGRRGVERFHERFTLERCASAMLALYEELVPASRRALREHYA